jgi:hypothetical protein
MEAVSPMGKVHPIHPSPAPDQLSPSSQSLYAELIRVYAITDLGGQEVLRSGLVSLDQAQAAEAQIQRDGQTFTDKFGQIKVHPLLPTARDFRAQWLQALKMLGLAMPADAPKPKPVMGRPPGTGGTYGGRR